MNDECPPKKAVILTDPEEMRKARLDQPSLTSEEKRKQRKEVMAAGLGTNASQPNKKSSAAGRERAAVS